MSDGLFWLVSCIVHILKHLTSQNEVKDGKINTCETSMSLAVALPCRSKLLSSVSELSFNVVLSCSSRSHPRSGRHDGTWKLVCSLAVRAGRARPAGPRRQELYPPNL